MQTGGLTQENQSLHELGRGSPCEGNLECDTRPRAGNLSSGLVMRTSVWAELDWAVGPML